MGKLKKDAHTKDIHPSRKASPGDQSEGAAAEPVTVDRRSQDRRKSSDRRHQNMPVAGERRKSERRKVPRRRQIDPTTCERDYTDDEIEFMGAMDAYKRSSGRMFPTCSEVLEVLQALGYEKRPKTLETAGLPSNALAAIP